jgi:fatty acid desaturase
LRRRSFADNLQPLKSLWWRFEGPTWALIITIYGGWGFITWLYTLFPIWVVAPAGAWLAAWHMSLQHEIIHGHPTRSARFNRLLGFPPVNLWLPFERYRQDHLIHHREAFLTDPGADPETWYLSGAAWHRLGWSGRTLRRIENTFSGRVLLGPIGVVSRFLVSEARQIAAGCRETAAIWLVHGVGVAAVLVWVLVVCRIPLHVYVVGFIYPGLALALIRSFAEHRAAEIPGHRTAIVEDRGPLALLFLHNNLHVVHHRRPDLPWFAIPACYHAERSEFIRRNGGLVYRNYGEVAVRFLVKPHHEPPHPMTATAAN